MRIREGEFGLKPARGQSSLRDFRIGRGGLPTVETVGYCHGVPMGRGDGGRAWPELVRLLEDGGIING
jgi:hypothetical protein